MLEKQSQSTQVFPPLTLELHPCSRGLLPVVSCHPLSMLLSGKVYILVLMYKVYVRVVLVLDISFCDCWESGKMNGALKGPTPSPSSLWLIENASAVPHAILGHKGTL